MVSLRTALVVSLAAVAACSSQPRPVAVKAGDTCAHCRMIVSDARMAGQVVAPGEDPLIYDDIGCLASAIGAGQPADHAFVADHRTGEWVRARTAAYTHVPALATPMGSHIIAHANDESRRADPAAAGGKPMTFGDVLSASRAGASSAAPGGRHAG
jgi:copper chaperone NosL